MRRILILIILITSANVVHAQHRMRIGEIAGKVMFRQTEENSYEIRPVFKNQKGDNVRLTAIALNISLGVLGVHRLYLGTDVKIAAAYALTCGGGCILWLVDLGLLIGSKDITPFLDNPRLFMWTIEE